MSLAFTYAVREMRAGFRGFRIFLLCLLLGVFTIGTVLSVSRSLLNAIEHDGKALLGGEIAIQQIYNPLDAPVLAWFTQRNAVFTQSVDMRSMALAPETDDSTLVELKAVDADYPLYGAVVTDPATDQLHQDLTGDVVYVDRAVLDRLQLNVGDTLQIGDTHFTIKGIVIREPDQASGGRWGLAPRVLMSRASLQKTGLEQPGSMSYYTLRVTFPIEPDLEKVTADLKSAFPASESWRIRTYKNASPQMERLIKRLTVFLTLAGLSGLLIGGIGVGNAVRAYMETRLKTIAMLKAVGADGGFIFSMYLGQILLLGSFAIVAGLILSGIVSVIAARSLADLVGLNVSMALSTYDAAITAIFGVLTILVFSLPPLFQALAMRPADLFRNVLTLPRLPLTASRLALLSGLTVAFAGLVIASSHDQRMAMYFIAATFVTFLAFHVCGGILMRLARAGRHSGLLALRLALQNLSRPGNMTHQIVLSIGLGLTVLVAISMVEYNFREGLQKGRPADSPSFFFLDIQKDQRAEFEKLVLSVPQTRDLHVTPNIRGRIVAVNGKLAEQALVDPSESWLLSNDRGLTYMQDMPPGAQISAGAWWETPYTGPPLLSVVDDVRRAFNIGIGDTITVNVLGRDVTATIANVREVTWTTFTINFSLTFSPGVLEDAPQTFLATVVAPTSAESDIQRAVARQFPNITIVNVNQAIQTVTGMMANMSLAVQATALVSFVTGLLVLAGAVASMQSRRSYETVVLKVLGARRKDILQAFVIEFGLAGLFAGAIAASLGSAASWAIVTHIMDWNWVFDVRPIAVAILAGCVAVIAVGFYGLNDMLQKRPLLYLRNE